MMPERSGLELVKRLRELDHIPFILLTATGDYASRRRSYELIAEVFQLEAQAA